RGRARHLARRAAGAAGAGRRQLHRGRRQLDPGRPARVQGPSAARGAPGAGRRAARRLVRRAGRPRPRGGEALTRSGAPAFRRLGAEVAPLSFAQERLWLIAAAAPGSVTYNVPILLRWRGRVDVAALGSALAAVVRRHEILRTTYRLRDGRPIQVVGAA